MVERLVFIKIIIFEDSLKAIKLNELCIDSEPYRLYY
jgi:hypothetical protein